MIDELPSAPVGKDKKSLGSRSIQELFSEQEFEQELASIVFDSILKGLSHFGGPKVADSILYILELDHGVSMQGLANDLEKFRKGLRKMFGESSGIIEYHVEVQLAKRIGTDPEGKDLDDLIALTRDYVNQKKINSE